MNTSQKDAMKRTAREVTALIDMRFYENGLPDLGEDKEAVNDVVYSLLKILRLSRVRHVNGRENPRT